MPTARLAGIAALPAGIAAAFAVAALGAGAAAGSPSPSECRSADPVCEYQANATQAQPVATITEKLPGAIEPAPVNQKVMEEFWARVAEHKQRGAAVVPLPAAWQMLLVPALHGGMVGWCAVLRGTAHDVARCPVSPLEGPRILYEAWEAGPSGTRGFALTTADVGAVTVNAGGKGVATAPIPGLTVSLSAAVVAIPAPFPGTWPDEFEGVVGGFAESQHGGFGAQPLTPSLTLPTAGWQAPQTPPAGPCELSAAPLKGLKPRAGRVVSSITPLAGVAGRGFLSCADTEYAFAHSSLDAAILLDTAQPGVLPVALPNAALVHHHPGLYSAPGWSGQILARRVGDAWLALEGGSSLRQRVQVLSHLRASVRP